MPLSPWRTLAFIALMLLSAIALPACSSNKSQANGAPRFAHGPANPSLVVASESSWQMYDESFTDWESGRLDGQLGAAGSPYGLDYGIAEIRQYDRLRSSNGRPRDHSWTYSRSIQRRSGP